MLTSAPAHPHPSLRPASWPTPRPLRFAVIALAIVGAIALAFAGVAGFFSRQAFTFFDAGGRAPVAAIYMSGDSGLRFGMGPHVAPALAARGIPVLGISSPALFGRHRSRAEVEQIVADGVRDAMRRSGADRIVLIGQSFGADMISTALPSLPDDLRPHVAAVVLVVPGQKAYFRADPLGFAYHGTPDAEPAAALRGVAWTPITCIYGAKETDSLCPELAGTATRVLSLPGGHFLSRNYDLLTATILQQLGPLAPAAKD